MGPDKKKYRRLRRAIARLVALCLLASVAVAFWRYSPLVEWSDPARLGASLRSLDTNPWAGPIVVAAFLLGSFVVFPVSAMIAATGIALGPTSGMLWASVGSLLAATVNYCIARTLPDRTIEGFVGPWLGRLGKRFENSGILAIMLARNFPFAPFTLINVVAGAARIPYRDFLTGTVLGMGPVIAALTILGDRIRGAWQSPDLLNVMLVVAAFVLWVLVAISLQSISNRLMSAR